MLDADSDAITNPERLNKLRVLHLLDTPADPAFDRLTRLASRFLKAPTALVSLIDENRQFFKSQVGLSEPWASLRQSPLENSYCKYVVMTEKPLIIEDSRKHPLGMNNNGTLTPGILAYAGIPLVTSDHFVLGALCVIDTRPREWTKEQISTLEDLAKSIMTEIELRSHLIERERIEAALRASEQYMQAVINSASVIVYTVDQDGLITMTEGKGLDAIGAISNRLVGQSVFEVYQDKPEVIDAVHKALNGTASTIQTTQDFPQGRVHYEAAISPLNDEDGYAIGAIGVLVDITDRVLAEQTLERSVQQLTLLRRVDGELSEKLDPDSVLMIAMDTALRASRAEHGFIGLIEGEAVAPDTQCRQLRHRHCLGW